MCPKFEKYVAEMDNFRQWSLSSRKSNGRRYVKLKKYPVHQKNFQKNSLKVEIWRFRLLAHGIRATAAEEQSAASEEINQSVSAVNSMSGQTAAAMGEATKAISDMAHQTETLANLVEKMKNE